MTTSLEKVSIPPQSEGSRTAHLQPIIDYLKARGNYPATGDNFCFDHDCYGIYGFMHPLDIEAIRAKFDLPPSIVLGQSTVYDSHNFLSIAQSNAAGQHTKQQQHMPGSQDAPA